MVLHDARVFKVAWARLGDERICQGGEQAASSVGWSQPWCPGQPFLTLDILCVYASSLLQLHNLYRVQNRESS